MIQQDCVINNDTNKVSVPLKTTVSPKSQHRIGLREVQSFFTLILSVCMTDICAEKNNLSFCDFYKKEYPKIVGIAELKSIKIFKFQMADSDIAGRNHI